MKRVWLFAGSLCLAGFVGCSASASTNQEQDGSSRSAVAEPEWARDEPADPPAAIAFKIQPIPDNDDNGPSAQEPPMPTLKAIPDDDL
jgi:hypothetical protein